VTATELGGWDCLPQWRSPLTPGVQLECVSYDREERTLLVELGHDWMRMLRQLSAAGEGLVMTRNEAAILGQRMVYPSPGVARNLAEGELWVDVRQFGAAHALHRRRETGHVFGVEFKDHAGNIVHRHTLTPESDLDEFCGWVRLHQACVVERAEDVPMSEPEERPPGSEVSWREPFAPRGLESLLSACGERGLWIKVAVAAAGVTQRAMLQPGAVKPLEDWWFASDDEVGLHFCPDGFGRASIEYHSVRGQSVPVVCASTAGEAAALVLGPADAGQLDSWRQLLRRLREEPESFNPTTETP